MRTSVSLWAALGALALVLAGCDQATNTTKTSSSSDTVSSTVYQIGSTWDGLSSSAWADTQMAVKPLTGKTISNVTYTFAVNAAAVTGAIGAGWKVDDAWAATAENPLTAAASTWATLTLTDAVTSPAAVTDVVLEFWHDGTSTLISVKSLNLTYADGSTEVLTFTSSSTPVHSVLTASGVATTTDAAFGDRFWTYSKNYTAASFTEGVTTVAY